MKQNKTIIQDTLQRPLRDLRISVTDRCNFRCTYCMPAEIFGADYPFLDKKQLLSYEELIRLIYIFQGLGVEKIRITGGEPLVRKGLPTFINMLGKIDGITDIAMTTNGSLLKKYAKNLKESGLDRVTVSLDSLDEDRFKQINGGFSSLHHVLEGIEEAAKVGLQVKINMVVKRGVNEQDILPMAKYMKKAGHILRFIEYMDVGNSNGWKLDHVVPSSEIVQSIHQEMPLEEIDANYYGEVARRYRYAGTSKEIGFISSVTQAFCSSCTRMRLSAEGKLYTCLFASEGHDLRSLVKLGKSDEEIRDFITQIWNQRGDRYSEERLQMTALQAKKKVEMSHIGG